MTIRDSMGNYDPATFPVSKPDSAVFTREAFDRATEAMKRQPVCAVEATVRLQQVHHENNFSHEPLYTYSSVTEENWKDIEIAAWILMPSGIPCQKSFAVYMALFGESAARWKYDEVYVSIETVRVVERERCAMLAEDGKREWNATEAGVAITQQVAGAIRARQ
jgi:hypothetical protein